MVAIVYGGRRVAHGCHCLRRPTGGTRLPLFTEADGRHTVDIAYGGRRVAHIIVYNITAATSSRLLLYTLPRRLLTRGCSFIFILVGCFLAAAPSSAPSWTSLNISNLNMLLHGPL
jgi:hypothetical protein